VAISSMNVGESVASTAIGAGDGVLRLGGGVLGTAVRFPHDSVQSPTSVKTMSLPSESVKSMQNRYVSELSSASL
jgi:hypothetical protein